MSNGGHAAADTDYEAFRAEVRAFIEENYTPAMREMNMRQAGAFAEPGLGQRWHRILYEKGWVAPSWPPEFGGPGWDAMQRHIFASECGGADTPSFPGFGLSLLGPALIRFGTPDQQSRFLPAILSGECYFCQGFSEPGAGSDLASLRTAAVRDGDEYVVNGSKIWTTHAHFANWIFLLVRTSNEGKPQTGITFLMAPMDTPGISVRPIISMSGEHEINQTFFDDVRIPVAFRIGDENKGWDVAKYLLEYERGSGFAAKAMASLERAKRIATLQPGDDGQNLWDDPSFRRRVAEVEIDQIALAATEQHLSELLVAGGTIGDVLASTIKIAGTQLLQMADELGVEALGDYAMADQREALTLDSNVPSIGPDYAAKPVARFLNDRATSIYGGSNEVLRGVIAKSAFGLR